MNANILSINKYIYKYYYRKLLYIFIFSIAGTSMLVRNSYSEDVRWLGVEDQYWSNEENWDDDFPPSDQDVAILNWNKSHISDEVVIADDSTTVSGLIIGDGPLGGGGIMGICKLELMFTLEYLMTL